MFIESRMLFRKLSAYSVKFLGFATMVFVLFGGVVACSSCATSVFEQTEDVRDHIQEIVMGDGLNRIPERSFVKVSTVYEAEGCSDDGTVCETVRDVKFTGSGVVLDKVGRYHHVLTAGHVCDEKHHEAPLKFMLGIRTHFKVTDMSTLRYKITLTNHFSMTKHEAQVVHLDRDNDICIIRAPDMYGVEVAKLSDRNRLKWGEKINVLAAPLGIHGEELLLPFSGKYAGIAANKNYADRSRVTQAWAFTVPAAGGSSGGPIFDLNGEVVGMIHSGPRRFENLSYSATTVAIRKALRNALSFEESFSNEAVVDYTKQSTKEE